MIRSKDFSTRFDAREEKGKKRIEGYFAVFGEDYEIMDGVTETIAPGAFDGQTSGDVRALTNHNKDLVLGRTTNGTLQLRQDERGLWGSIDINEEDQDALNLYARVKRGDVSQCSFGFDVEEQRQEDLGGGKWKFTLVRVKLYEVSVCTFPAYEATGVVARVRAAEEARDRKRDVWRANARKRLEERSHGA